MKKPKYRFLPNTRYYKITIAKLWETRLKIKNERRAQNGLPPLEDYTQV